MLQVASDSSMLTDNTADCIVAFLSVMTHKMEGYYNKSDTTTAMYILEKIRRTSFMLFHTQIEAWIEMPIRANRHILLCHLTVVNLCRFC